MVRSRFGNRNSGGAVISAVVAKKLTLTQGGVKENGNTVKIKS